MWDVLAKFGFVGCLYRSFNSGMCTFGRTFLFPHDPDQKGMSLNESQNHSDSPYRKYFTSPSLYQGITTYEYVVAMRAMSEAPPASADEEVPNPIYSPTNSATTGLSVGSSLSIQYKGVWCTPPRVFVDQQVSLH